VISKGGQPVDVEEKHVQILDRNKAEKRFKKLFGWIVAVIGVTLILFAVFPKNVNESGLTAGKSFVMGQNTFVYANAKRYSNHTYRLGFYVSDNQIDPLATVRSKVRTRGHENGEILSSSLTQVSPDYYVVTVKQVPKNQALLYVLIGDKKTTGSGLEAANSQALLVQKAKDAGSYKSPSTHQLQQEYLAYMVKYYSQKIKKLEHKLAKNKSNIVTLKKTLAKQNQSLDLQTGSQKSDTKSKIAQTKSSIKQHQTTAVKTRKAITSAAQAQTNYAEKLD
jgi:uncharacterized coiled-coil protein SlyX